jgi:hypothetical protein
MLMVLMLGWLLLLLPLSVLIGKMIARDAPTPGNGLG